MKPSSSLIAVMLVAASLAGCKSLLKKRLPVAADSAPVAAAPPPAVPPAPSAVVAPAPSAGSAEEAAVPAPEDFEDEAFDKVTAQNFRSEFARLSQEISAGK